MHYDEHKYVHICVRHFVHYDIQLWLGPLELGIGLGHRFRDRSDRAWDRSDRARDRSDRARERSDRAKDGSDRAK